jgi:xanthine dehydrogenase molybdopterin-binding subunit B
MRSEAWATSTPFRVRGDLAAALGLDEAGIQVIVPDYGGGFGGKHGPAVALEAARLARAADSPVKVAWNQRTAGSPPPLLGLRAKFHQLLTYPLGGFYRSGHEGHDRQGVPGTCP